MTGPGTERGEQPGAAERRSVTYCLIPPELAPKLHDLLRRHFRDEPDVEVVVERRGRERRRGAERRVAEGEPPGGEERRRIRNPDGRRVGDRREAQSPVEPPPLPRRARGAAERIAFVACSEPAGQRAEDLDTARLVTRFQAGEEQVFTELYRRYFDRLYSYLRAMLRDRHEAEDATQQVFANALVALPGYERRSQPFRAWLLALARNAAISELRKRQRLEVQPPEEIERQREAAAEPAIVDWLSDRDLMLFVERLPLPQRQVLMLRYVIGLGNTEIAKLLGRTPTDVGKLHHRAVAFLRARLEAVGRIPGGEQGERVEWRRRTTRTQILRARRFALTQRL